MYIPFPRPLPTCGGAGLLPLPRPLADPLPRPRPIVEAVGERVVVAGGAVGERVERVVVAGGAVGERVVERVTCNYNYSCSHSLQLSMHSSVSGDSGTCSASTTNRWTVHILY